MQKLLCGAAKGDITPREELFPMPLLGPLKINHINDRIHVRTLAFETDGERVLLISLDMILVPHGNELLSFLSDKFKIPKKSILLCATHTHETSPIGLPHISEPDPEDERKCNEWYADMKRIICETVQKSLSSMRPCKIGYGEGKSYVNCNRDEIKTEKAELGFNFERPSDKTLKLVRIEDEKGKIIALLINYACHAVVMNGCIEKGGVGLSGDLPGRTSLEIERLYPDSVCLWTSGAAGDQNPRMMTNFGVKIIDGKPVYRNLGDTGYMVLDLLTEEHVRDVLKTNENIVCSAVEGELRSRQTICKCSKKVSGEIEYTLSVMIVGDIAFEGIDGEVATSIGKSVTDVSPYDRTILITHANGYKGYIPDDWQIEHNSFEAEGVAVKEGYIEKNFVELFQKEFQCLKEENKNG